MPVSVATVGLVMVGLDQPIAIVAMLVAVALLAVRWRRLRSAPRRIAVLGSAAAAEALAIELGRLARHPVMAGRIASTPPAVLDRYWLGPLSDLGSLVERHDLDLLLLARGVPRLEVFDELDRSCSDGRVRMCELSQFYEQRFGQVPIAEINSAWLQCIMHPHYSVAPPAAKRAFDIAFALTAGLISAPLILALALLIRRDGGPALYRQTRVGEGGRQFTILKLRTMTASGDGWSPWTSEADERVTAHGAWLRRTHLDELPQLANVLRGEMSVVGPRPEQPCYVKTLERSIRFYSRRHQLRPGLTGWAQVRGGYGGSELGTAWKLSHDLYYLKHHSARLDLEILVRTLSTPFAADPFNEPGRRPLVLGELAIEAMTDVTPMRSEPIAVTANTN